MIMLRVWALETSVLQIVHGGNDAYLSSYLMNDFDNFTEGKVAAE